MPAQCNISNCEKNASLAGPGLADFPLICGHHTKQLWAKYIYVRRGGVPNPFFDATSNEDHKMLEILPLSTSSTRLRNLEFTLMFPPGTPLGIIEKALPLLIKARGGRNKRFKGTNDANAAARDNAIKEAGAMVDLTRKEHKRAIKTFVHLYNGCCDNQRDLINISKVSVQPVEGSRNVVLNQEAERKYRNKDVSILLGENAAITPLGSSPGTMMVLEVDSIEEFKKTEAEVRNNRNGPSVVHLTMQLCRETTNGAARDLEKACQNICTTQKVPNHIEDDIYHQGGIGEPAAVTFSIAIKALDSVRRGPFSSTRTCHPFHSSHEKALRMGP